MWTCVRRPRRPEAVRRLPGGHGIRGTVDFFEQIGLRPDNLHAWYAAAAEFLGAALIALDLATPFAAAALIGMITAALTVHLGKGCFVTGSDGVARVTLAHGRGEGFGGLRRSRSTARPADSSESGGVKSVVSRTVDRGRITELDIIRTRATL